MRVGLYARVSTVDKDQDPENQLVLLREEARLAGDTIIKEYVDEKSGGQADRPAFLEMLADARRHRFDMVRVFALDRFSSEGIEPVFRYLGILHKNRVRFWSYCEPEISNMGEMADLFTSIFAWAAKYRNKRHSENVRLGQARKRAQVEATGQEYVHGRRATKGDVVAEVKRLGAEGLSRRKIAAATGVSVGTVQKYLK